MTFARQLQARVTGPCADHFIAPALKDRFNQVDGIDFIVNHQNQTLRHLTPVFAASHN